MKKGDLISRSAVLEYAPEWDGHTPDEAICRIRNLKKLLSMNDERRKTQ